VFNEAWIWLAFFFAIVGLLIGQGSLGTLGALLLTVVPVAYLWNRYALRRVEYERAFSENRAFAGETVELAVRLTNRKWLPLAWVHLEDQVPLQVPFVEGNVVPSPMPRIGFLANLTAARWFEQVTWRYQLRCRQRGFYFFGPINLRSGDVFGLFQTQTTLPHADRLIVYPRIVPLPELGFPGKQPFGEKRGRQLIFEDPSRTSGVRDYQPGDPFKRIHWKATARRQSLQVRLYEPSIIQHLAVFLNVATFARDWHGINVPLLERAIVVAASIAAHAARARYAVGLIANGSVPQSDQPIKVMPGRDPDQLMRILEALAAVSGFPTADMEKLLLAESSHLAWGATMVVVTGVVTDEILAAMLRLQQAGRRLALVSLDTAYTDAGPPGITTYHLDPEAIDLGEVDWGPEVMTDTVSRPMSQVT